MIWYTGMCSIMVMGLLYGLTLWSMCVCEGFGSNGFMTKAQSFPMDGHYRTNIISSIGHPRLDSVIHLVLCIVAHTMAGVRVLY
jgi:hypothetical protein